MAATGSLHMHGHSWLGVVRMPGCVLWSGPCRIGVHHCIGVSLIPCLLLSWLSRAVRITMFLYVDIGSAGHGIAVV